MRPIFSLATLRLKGMQSIAINVRSRYGDSIETFMQRSVR